MRQSHYLGGHRTLTTTAEGARVLLDTRDMILTPPALLTGTWEAGTTAALKRLLKPGMHFVDVGANIGWFSILANLLVGPSGWITAYEPEPDAFDLLRDNMALNYRFAGLSLHRAAAHNHANGCGLFIRERYRGNTAAISIGEDRLSACGDTERAIATPTARLDATLTRPADVVKMDIEGCEPYAIEGAGDWLDRAALLIEWSPCQIYDAGRTPTDLLDILAGRHLFSLDETGTAFPVARDRLLSKPDSLMLLVKP